MTELRFSSPAVGVFGLLGERSHAPMHPLPWPPNAWVPDLLARCCAVMSLLLLLPQLCVSLLSPAVTLPRTLYSCPYSPSPPFLQPLLTGGEENGGED